MPESQQQADVRIAVTSALIFGVFLGAALFGLIISLMPNTATGLDDTDLDGVPDSHDLLVDGNARMRITVTSLMHEKLAEDTNITLNITFDGNGDPSGNHDAQNCTLNFTIFANTTGTSPAIGCTFDTSDWSMLAVGFGYSMTHTEETEFDGTLTHHWDLFSGGSSDTAGYNSSMDAWILHQGTAIILDGMSDSDDNDWNGMLTIVFAADDEMVS